MIYKYKGKYHLSCNLCGIDLNLDGEDIVFDSKREASEWAFNHGWSEKNNKHLCLDCKKNHRNIKVYYL